jgi:hypothetical protein
MIPCHREEQRKGDGLYSFFPLNKEVLIMFFKKKTLTGLARTCG